MLTSTQTQAFVLVAAIVCGLTVYMAIDLRKKLNLVDHVLEQINNAAAKAVTKQDLEDLVVKPPPIHVKKEPPAEVIDLDDENDGVGNAKGGAEDTPSPKNDTTESDIAPPVTMTIIPQRQSKRRRI